MVDTKQVHDNLLALLDQNQVSYRHFTHKAALSYEELADVQKDAGFFGTEMKCLVLKAGENFIVYSTLQGRKVNFESMKASLGVEKVRLATPEELAEHFGAQPGCAYPFGFDSQYAIFIDPAVYQQEWVLFSPVVPTETIQARGADLKQVFGALENTATETKHFNQPL